MAGKSAKECEADMAKHMKEMRKGKGGFVPFEKKGAGKAPPKSKGRGKGY